MLSEHFWFLINNHNDNNNISSFIIYTLPTNSLEIISDNSLNRLNFYGRGGSTIVQKWPKLFENNIKHQSLKEQQCNNNMNSFFFIQDNSSEFLYIISSVSFSTSLSPSSQSYETDKVNDNDNNDDFLIDIIKGKIFKSQISIKQYFSAILLEQFTSSLRQTSNISGIWISTIERLSVYFLLLSPDNRQVLLQKYVVLLIFDYILLMMIIINILNSFFKVYL